MDEKISVFAVSDHQLRVHTASGVNDHEWSCNAQKTFEEKVIIKLFSNQHVLKNSKNYMQCCKEKIKLMKTTVE